MARLCTLVFITNAAAWTAPRRPAPLRDRCTALRVAKRGDRAKKKVKLKDKIISEARPASTGRRVEDAHARTWIDGAEAAWLAAEGGDAAGAFADANTDAAYGGWLRLSSPWAMAADAAPPDLDAAAGAVAATERWCRWIADVKLCPWAKKSLETPAACKFAVSDAETPGAFAADVLAASRRAAASAADASAGIAFVVAPKFLPDDFEAFAAFLEELEDDVVPDAVPDVQVAGFHPAWTFAGLDDDDPLRGGGALFFFPPKRAFGASQALREARAAPDGVRRQIRRPRRRGLGAHRRRQRGDARAPRPRRAPRGLRGLRASTALRSSGAAPRGDRDVLRWRLGGGSCAAPGGPVRTEMYLDGA